MLISPTVPRAATSLIVALLLTTGLAACGDDGDGGPAGGGTDRAAALTDWCSGALPEATLAGAGLPGTFATAAGWGEPGEEVMGVICGFTSDTAVGFAMGRAEFPTEADAAEFVGQLPDETGSVDTFDSFSTSLNPYMNYSMKVQRGRIVVQSYIEQCPDEETCDEASAALAIVVADAAAPDVSGACATDDGDEYKVLPLVADVEGEHAFALLDDAGKVAYLTATGAGGLSTNVMFTMAGHAVSPDDVESDSSGGVVSVEGRAVLRAGDGLEDLGYVLEKSWAINLGGGKAAVTSYEGEAEPPAIDGRFFVSSATPCTTL
ncbi:hypothetical protein [Nocardioides sp.]|uniref:hypothetical protein n=1 Tax=Nocardioides sp. TaxID=35761 RepID=UPI003516B1F6